MFRFNFVNLSAAPLTVVRMFLLVDGEKYEFLFPEQQVYQMTRHQNGETIPIREVKSQKLPFRIEGKGALGGYFAVYLPIDMEKTFKQLENGSLLFKRRKRKNILTYCG